MNKSVNSTTETKIRIKTCSQCVTSNTLMLINVALLCPMNFVSNCLLPPATF